MLRRISSVAVAVAMLVTMLCTFSVGSAEGGMMMTLTPSAQKVRRGEQVTVTVGIQNYTPVAGLTLVNEIDGAALEYVSSETTKISDEIKFTNPNYTAGGTYPNDGHFRIRSTWARATNIVAEESNFDIWTIPYTVPEDAPLGETAVKVMFTEALVWDDTLNGLVSLLGTGAVVEEATLNLEIYCEHAETEIAYEGVTDGEHRHRTTCTACGTYTAEACSFGAWTLVKNPTAAQPGENERYCSECNHRDTQEIPVIPGFVIEAETNAITGREWIADVTIKNTEAGFSAVVVDVAYDHSVMSLTDVAMADGSTSDFLHWKDNEDGTVSIAYITPGVYTNEESFIRLTFAVAEAAVTGDYSVTVSTTDAVAGESGAEEQITLASAVKDIYVSNYAWGDVNADGTADAQDVVMILRYNVQLSEYEDLKCPSAADAWADGRIDLRDAIILLRYVVGLYTPPAA